MLPASFVWSFSLLTACFNTEDERLADCLDDASAECCSLFDCPEGEICWFS